MDCLSRKLLGGFLFIGLVCVGLISCTHRQADEKVPHRQSASQADVFSAMPPKPTNSYQDEQIWNRYCQGNRLSSEIPKPNYADKEIQSAVRRLAQVASLSYYFYSGPLYAYELRVGKSKDLVDVPANFPNVSEVENGKRNANAFLTLLCGEFRDRPSLIQAKIKWVLNMRTLPVTTQKHIGVKEDFWSQFSAHSYAKYIENTRAIFSAKEGYAKSTNQFVKMGKYSESSPIEPFTICETKFIFNRFVMNNSLFSEKNKGFESYKTQYTKFKNNPNMCSKEDLNYVYDFRGDSNFKPNSPESNGMIWFSKTMGTVCTRVNGKMTLKDAVKDKFQDQDICEKYFTSPFSYRWSAARAGLAAWMLRDSKHDFVFSNTRSNVTIVPHFEPQLKPFGFKLPYSESEDIYEIEKNEKGEAQVYDVEKGDYILLNAEQVIEKQKEIDLKKLALAEKKKNAEAVRFDYFKQWQDNQAQFWIQPDLGLNQIFNFSLANSGKPNTELAFERLRDAVNRHTDWYASGYIDGFGQEAKEAYSPFVASSYEMSASDGFTAPGVTVNSPSDGCKHWMFVFKLHKDQWYSTKSVQNKTPIDFNRHWFDETSLGTNHLADSERALDRMGTALEGEMDSILYLHNITTSKQVDAMCGKKKEETLQKQDQAIEKIGN